MTASLEQTTTAPAGVPTGAAVHAALRDAARHLRTAARTCRALGAPTAGVVFDDQASDIDALLEGMTP